MNKSILFISIDPIEYRRRVLNEIETAQNAGFEAIVISTTSADLIRSKYDFDYKRIYLPKSISRGFIRFPLFNLTLLFLILFRKFDVIHFRGIIPMPAILFRQFFRKSILIYDAHEYFRGHQVLDNRPFQRYFWMWFEKKMSRHLEYLITVSEPLGDLFKHDYPKLKNIEILRSLPSLEQEKGKIFIRKKSIENKIALFHGYFLAGRALENIITAFTKIKDKSIKLLLIGEGPLKQKLKEMVDSLDLNNTIEFVNFIPNEQLIEYIRKATIGLSIIQADCTNRKFALPNKFFEYIHAGLPVLASNIPTLDAYTQKYKVGRTVDPENPAEIAKVIEEMVSDPFQLEKWGINCKQASKKLNWQNESQKLAEIYSGIFNRKQ
jgi:glycosyltransferase involved in cell wall biosynthesis